MTKSLINVSQTTEPNLPSPSISATSQNDDFDIFSTYTDLLTSDPHLTMPIAAIESLIHLLSHKSPITISETLSLIAQYTATLKASVPNPISLSAGTDLIQRYLTSSLQPSPGTKAGKGFQRGVAGGADDFQAVKEHLVSNVLLFVQRAKEARGVIGRTASRFLRDGETVLTAGGSRVVGAVLEDAMRRGVRFRVVWVQDEIDKKENASLVRQLRGGEVPVAIIPASAVAYSMGLVNMVMVGAEGVVENGGIISRMGTYQLGLLAKRSRKPVYVVAESHKFVRLYPLGQYDLPIRQTILDFQTRDDFDKHQGAQKEGIKNEAEAVDYTPPELIKALVTEVGIHTPSAVSEELIKIWY